MNNWLFSIFPNDLFIDLTLYQYGWEACAPLHSFGPAIRNHYLFHYIISGKGTLTIADEKGENKYYNLGAGMGFLITPQTVTTYAADEDDPWDYTWLEFDGLKVKEFLETVGLSSEHPIFHAKTETLGDIDKEEMLYISHTLTQSSFHLIGHLYFFLDALQQPTASPAITTG